MGFRPAGHLRSCREPADASGMADSEELAHGVSAAARVATLGEHLNQVGHRFSDAGALGVVLVDAGAFACIERQSGGDALRDALVRLCQLVREIVDDSLGIGDLVLAGETGRNEILVLLFREPGESRYYTRELPDLMRLLSDGLAKRGNRVCYPHLRETPPLRFGTGAALRNPTVRPETQLRQAIAEARSHAELNAKSEQRRQRKQLFEVVLAGQIRSVYEPIVEVATHTVFGYEALARGPEGSELRSPVVLFERAAQEDLIFQLDCLCRRSGIAGARDLPGGAKLFLNVRPTTIHDPAFKAEAITRTLAESRLTPSDVVFEISEQESIRNFDVFREVRDYYRRLGIQIALDDLGQGYSSLESILELEPEFIKVDRAFCSGIDLDERRQELLRSLTHVAGRIHARLIGEGLDTLEELTTLGRLGIPFGQGWLFGKPTPLRSDL
jgi:EAL domain-containing protein (putative c-di-GMP-specific phosphodiesterase class I)